MKLVILLSRKKNARGEDALESLHKPSVMQTVLGQLQEIEHLGSALEAHDAAPLVRASVAIQIGISRSWPKGSRSSDDP